MSKIYDVVGIGNAIVDILGQVDESTLAKSGLRKGDMTLVDLDQSRALYGLLGETTERSGGSAANTLAGLAALGSKTAFIGKVRDDQFGEVFAHDIAATGCTFPVAKARDGDETGRCVVLITPDAERTMATYLGAAVDVGPADVDEATVSDASVLYLEGYLWNKPEAINAFREAARLTRRAGGKVAFTTSAEFCVNIHRAAFLDLIENDVDILFANEVELCALYETDDFDTAFAAATCMVETVAATRSEHGAMVARGTDRAHVPADAIAKIVDATGAGDLFASGFLYGLTRDEDARICGAMGCAAASVVIQQIGARCEEPLRAKFTERGWI